MGGGPFGGPFFQGTQNANQHARQTKKNPKLNQTTSKNHKILTIALQQLKESLSKRSLQKDQGIFRNCMTFRDEHKE